MGFAPPSTFMKVQKVQNTSEITSVGAILEKREPLRWYAVCCILALEGMVTKGMVSCVLYTGP